MITENALAWSVSLVDEKTIDEINILQATYRAMRQAVEGLTRPADFTYVDGNRSEGLGLPHECVVAGDAKIPSVAAASILAKVTRDRLMRRFAEQYPAYGFEKHKGYETRAHDQALLANGPCPIHRRTLPEKVLRKASGGAAMKGAWGERAARAFLEQRGYRPEAINFRTRFGEIDMIARDGKYVATYRGQDAEKRPLRRSARACDRSQAGARHRGGGGLAAGASVRPSAAV